jgi:hypothetical protein
LSAGARYYGPQRTCWALFKRLLAEAVSERQSLCSLNAKKGCRRKVVSSESRGHDQVRKPLRLAMSVADGIWFGKAVSGGVLSSAACGAMLATRSHQ